MKRRQLFASLASALGVSALISSEGRAFAAASPSKARYDKCAKACLENAKDCAACAAHCAGMVKAGMKEHVVSLELSRDCGDICELGGKLCGRKGPLAVAQAEACLKACLACGKECAKYPKMAKMAVCAKSCAKCAAACRELIAAAKA